MYIRTKKICYPNDSIRVIKRRIFFFEKVKNSQQNKRNYITRGSLFLAEFLLATITIFFLFNAPAYLAKIKSLTLSFEASNFYYLSAKEDPFSISPAPSSENSQEEKIYLKIPDINLEIPVFESQDSSLVNSLLEKGAVLIREKDEENRSENLLIVGHSSTYPWQKTAPVFATLPEIKEDAQISLTKSEEVSYFRVIKKEIVSPKNIKLPMMKDKSLLTLMTCVPVGTTKDRLLVIAEKID